MLTNYLAMVRFSNAQRSTLNAQRSTLNEATEEQEQEQEQENEEEAWRGAAFFGAGN
jgi:hypothetical protein